MLNKNLIKTKIRSIQEYLVEIEPILSLPKDQVVSNIEKLRALERNFQLIVDAMLDINIHFIRELELGSPDDLKSTFVILVEGKIIPLDFAQKISPVVGLRNILVHGYEKVDRGLFVDSFQKNRQDFDKYLLLINSFLDDKK
ncbi:MAG: hypothetical protein A2W59_02325 [Candidatus Terrybacteria bacterium RIFCSPHIGHO2_02_41_19]|uniref:DUF86 domain-containing protein n=1 Tax=Candidatus Terrybacteria bacterium RIFCSPHIGHO2_02_41_19 TaxID=1802364 RepID=A0A1G2PN07_9BACT|nr:MAG: hypothetical protein A2W59_02325 [Candidatus Terrybacteria bacterium RIFCSPHIGHO2_02_41_19]